MTDLLRKNLAPITDTAWQAIEEQAARTLKGNLVLRAMVDFSGPHGLAMAAVNTGKLLPVSAKAAAGVNWSLRETLPLIEARTTFQLQRAELDAVERGARDPDLTALMDAARRLALFEEDALLNGLPDAGIKGLAKASAHKPLAMAHKSAEAVFEAAAGAVLALEKSGVNGPYALVLGDDAYQTLRLGNPNGYPVDRRAAHLLAGGIRWSPAVRGGLLLSQRGGDFELTVGQDLAIGYQEHNAETVTLFMIESFTFRVLEPKAAIVLTPDTKANGSR